MPSSVSRRRCRVRVLIASSLASDCSVGRRPASAFQHLFHRVGDSGVLVMLLQLGIELRGNRQAALRCGYKGKIQIAGAKHQCITRRVKVIKRAKCSSSNARCSGHASIRCAAGEYVRQSCIVPWPSSREAHISHDMGRLLSLVCQIMGSR